MAELSYPLNLNPATQARIGFNCYKAQPIDMASSAAIQEGFSGILSAGKGALLNSIQANNTFADFLGIGGEKQEGDEGKTAEEAKADAEAAAAQKNASTQKILEGLQGFKYFLDTKSPKVSMYVPLSLAYNDNIIYDNVNLGAAGAAFGRALNEGSGLIGAIGQGFFDGLSNATEVLSKGIGAVGEGAAGRLAAQRTVQLASGKLSPGIANTATLALQTTVNPNTRSMFRGVAIREFTFTFQMVPRSEREAREAQKIIQFFRQRMYPTTFNPFSQTSTIPIGYEFPDLFRISFKIGNTRIKIPRIHLAYLRNCQVNYNPTGSSFHDDGQPNEMTITLNFMEHKTLSRKEIGNASGDESELSERQEVTKRIYGAGMSSDGY